MTNEKEKQYREEFEATNWEMETDFIDVYLAACKKREEEIEKRDIEIRDALSFIENCCVGADDESATEKINIIKSHLSDSSMAKRYELMDEVEQLENQLVHLRQQLEETEKELYQQRFNNKHNLSIDQKVSDEIASLKKQLEDVKATDHYKKNQFWENAHANIQKDNNEIFRRMKLLESLISQAVPWVDQLRCLVMGKELKLKMYDWLKQAEESLK